jgi:hypothetical protein
MAKKKKSVQNHELKIFGTQVVGVAALGLALMAVVGLQTTFALLAIGLGAVSVWSAVRHKDYTFLFLGITAILIGLVAIWNWASQVMAMPY